MSKQANPLNSATLPAPTDEYDRRDATRHAMQLFSAPVTLQGADGETTGRLADESMDGLGVRLDEPPPFSVGELVEVDCPCSVRAIGCNSSTATVVYIESAAPALWRVGLRWV